MLDQCSDILTVPEVAKLLGTGRGRIYEMLAEGSLRGFQIGKVWKIPKVAVEDYVLTSCGMK